MRTNPQIRNPYIRGLAARELLGYRKSYWRTINFQSPALDLQWYRARYTAKILAAINAFARVDLHLRRHGEALVSGNTEPLKGYPAGFAGHG